MPFVPRRESCDLPAGTAAPTVASAEPVGPEQRNTFVVPLRNSAGTHHRLKPSPPRNGRARRCRRYCSAALAVTVAVHLGLLALTAKNGSAHGVERVISVGQRAGHSWETWLRGCPACREDAGGNDSRPPR
jgi:hypothetical protein